LQEQQGLMELLHHPHKVVHAGRDFWLGELHGRPVVLALSKIGKVAAATTATALIERFGVRRMVFTGVAGGLGKDVNVGDVVVASDFVQHDLDASPLFPRYEVPLYGRTRFDGDAALRRCCSMRHRWRWVMVALAAQFGISRGARSPGPDRQRRPFCFRRRRVARPACRADGRGP
jgi:uridine phosphorylase